MVIAQAQIRSIDSGKIRDMIFFGETHEQAVSNIETTCEQSGACCEVLSQLNRTEPFPVGTVFLTGDGYRLRMAADGTLTGGDLRYDDIEQFLRAVETARILGADEL